MHTLLAVLRLLQCRSCIQKDTVLVQQVVGERRCPIIDTWWQTEVRLLTLTPALLLSEDLHALLARLLALSIASLHAHVALRAPLSGVLTTLVDMIPQIILKFSNHNVAPVTATERGCVRCKAF